MNDRPSEEILAKVRKLLAEREAERKARGESSGNPRSGDTETAQFETDIARLAREAGGE